jgi:hypothetical protein
MLRIPIRLRDMCCFLHSGKIALDKLHLGVQNAVVLSWVLLASGNFVQPVWRPSLDRVICSHSRLARADAPFGRAMVGRVLTAARGERRGVFRARFLAVAAHADFVKRRLHPIFGRMAQGFSIGRQRRWGRGRTQWNLPVS